MAIHGIQLQRMLAVGPRLQTRIKVRYAYKGTGISTPVTRALSPGRFGVRVRGSGFGVGETNPEPQHAKHQKHTCGDVDVCHAGEAVGAAHVTALETREARAALVLEAYLAHVHLPTAPGCGG